jgi:D-beta-D-heptose 7-phosphate kinase/D-beta-D-heptose 1-phosphate adenosyltransferase
MIMSPQEATTVAKERNRVGARRALVFANGCFDILHAGHIHMLNFARSMYLNPVLWVAVNSDESVTRLKGFGRPINTLGDRMFVLDALKIVDVVTWFDEDTPEGLIRAINPQALLKGEDSQDKPVPGADYVRSIGGKVIFGPYIEGISTTKIIAKARR